MGLVGLKTRSPGQIFEKPSVRSRGHILSTKIMKLTQNVCLDKPQIRSKTRSPGQILGKPFIRFRVHTFSPIIMKLGQNVYLDKIVDKLENGSCRVKN